MRLRSLTATRACGRTGCLSRRPFRRNRSDSMDMTQRRCYEQVERTLLKGFVSLLIQPQRSPTSSFTRQQESDRPPATSERIHLDKANPNLLYDEITTIDNALTRPWVVDKTFQRVVSDKPIWFGHGVCREGN